MVPAKNDFGRERKPILGEFLVVECMEGQLSYNFALKKCIFHVIEMLNILKYPSCVYKNGYD